MKRNYIYNEIFRVRSRFLFQRFNFLLIFIFWPIKNSNLDKKITIKEIAVKAKVSSGTVDRVLHNRGEVSPKTREKVLKIIREGNYEPNIFARNLVLNKNYNIISLLPQYHIGEYWASQAMGIQQAHEELKAFGINNTFRYFNESDAGLFEKEALQALKDNPDGILLAPIIYHKAKWLAQLCLQKNIPVIIIDSDIASVNKLAFIGQDAFKSGRLAAKLLDYGGEKETVHLITITKSTDNNLILKQRKKGFIDYYKASKNTARILIKDIHAEEDNFDARLQDVAGSFSPGDKIFIPNSKVYQIAGILHDHFPSLKVRLVGYDLIPNNLKYLDAGTIDFLINQKPEVQGYQGVQLLYKYLVLKQEVQSRIFMPLEIVTKENMDFVNF